MVLDIIVAAILLLITFIGYKKGAAGMLIGIAMMFVSFVAAAWVSKWLSGVMYQSFFAPSVDKAAASAAASAGDLVSQLPWWAQKALDFSGKEIASAGSEGLANAINAVVQPIVTGILTVILTLILFLIIDLILHKLLLKPILAVFRLPFVRTVDRIIGAIIGAAEGVLIVCMLAFVLKLVLPYIDTNAGFLNESTIYNSFIFYHFYSGNIFTTITSWIS